METNERDDTRPEHHNDTPPRIYVASLSDYNAGRLHGTWINADQDVDDINQDVQTMLHRSSEPIAEEWAIHDYEGFGDFHLHEYESLDVVARLGAGIAEHGEAFAAYANLVGTEPGMLEDFEDRYLGTWDSLEEYAENLLDDLGVDTEAIGPDWLQPYLRFDLEAFVRDAASELNVSRDARVCMSSKLERAPSDVAGGQTFWSDSLTKHLLRPD